MIDRPKTVNYWVKKCKCQKATATVQERQIVGRAIWTGGDEPPVCQCGKPWKKTFVTVEEAA